MYTLNRIILLSALLKTGFLPAQIAISTDKMNVLYPGLENPITLVVSDIPDSNLLLIPSMGEIRRTSVGHYGWTICHRDTNFANLVIRDLKGDLVLTTKFFRVNRVLTPTPYLDNGYRSRVLSHGEYCRTGGISLVLENFDFDLRCLVIYFNIQYFSHGSDSVVKRNNGARWSSEVRELINRASPGDEYHFYNIAYRCGCDPMVHHLSEELHYRIK
jgi:hypothetical protein